MSFDDRWTHGMDGWRVQVVAGNSRAYGLYGEVTGFDPIPCAFHVVIDGSEDPVAFYWHEVRPA